MTTSPTGRRRLSKEERAALAAPLPESYRSLSQPEIDALWRTGSKVEQRRLGREGILPSWLRVSPNRARFAEENAPYSRNGIWAIDPPTPYSGLAIESRGKMYEALQGADGRVRYFVDNREVDKLPSTPLVKLLLREFATMEHMQRMPTLSPEQVEHIRQLKKNRAGQIINPYPGESAGKAVFGSSRKYDDEIREAMARAFFVDWYASEQERRQEEGLKANIARGGEDWMDVAPGTSRAAKKHAREYAVKLSAANKGATLTDLFAAALNAGGTGDARTFGHYMAMQAMGHGVSWFDDNPEFPIEVPHGEFYQ